MNGRFFAVLMLMVALAGPATAQEPDSLSLEAVIALVVKNNPTGHAAGHALAAAQAAADAASSRFYPQARADVSYTRLGPVAEISLPGSGAFRLYPADNYDGRVSVHQTVYDFGRTSRSADLASSHITLAEDQVEQVKSGLAYAAVQSFYTILFLDQDIRVQDDQINTLNEYLSFTQKKVGAGAATEFDVLTTRVRIAAAQNKRIDLINRRRKEEIALRRLADLPGDGPLRLQGSFEAGSVSVDADSLLALAAQRRIELKQANDAVHSAEVRSRVAAAADNPTVNVDLAYGAKNGYIPNLDVLRGNFVAGLSVHVPLYDGSMNSNLVQEAEANLLAARDQKNAVAARIRSDLLDAISDLRASMEKLQTSTLDVEQARRAVELAKAKYDAGVITNLDLLDAQTALEQARLADLQSLYGFVLSKYGLRRAVGERIW